MRARSAFFVLVACSFDVPKEGASARECSDGIDNDGNSRVDCDDPACACGADADADTDTDTGPPPCDELYGDAPGYLPCGGVDGGCRFSADTSTRNCAELCEAHAGTCLEVHEVGDFACDEGAYGFCDSATADTLICTCSR